MAKRGSHAIRSPSVTFSLVQAHHSLPMVCCHFDRPGSVFRHPCLQFSSNERNPGEERSGEKQDSRRLTNGGRRWLSVP